MSEINKFDVIGTSLSVTKNIPVFEIPYDIKATTIEIDNFPNHNNTFFYKIVYLLLLREEHQFERGFL
jgi:hypothetical protein